MARTVLVPPKPRYVYDFATRAVCFREYPEDEPHPISVDVLVGHLNAKYTSIVALQRENRIMKKALSLPANKPLTHLK